MVKKDIFKESEFKKDKKSLKISFIILGLFLVTQIIGLVLIYYGAIPEALGENNSDITPENMFLNMLISFAIAVTIFILLVRYKWKKFIKIWFGAVILLTLSISIYAIFHSIGFIGETYYLIAIALAIPFTLMKIFRPTVLIHNITEIFVYSGISLVLVNQISPPFVIILLLVISIYDMWAVWHTRVMQKMAKFQMEEVRIFNGFLIPYMTPLLKKKIQKSKKENENANIKVPIALLGGGDIAFTMIPAGVFLKNFGWIPALFIVLGALFGLSFLMLRSNKKRFYPAMPFITLGILSMIVVYFLLTFIGIL